MLASPYFCLFTSPAEGMSHLTINTPITPPTQTNHTAQHAESSGHDTQRHGQLEQTEPCY